MSLPISAVILAGGKGTRLRSVLPDTPKILASVNGRPFITYVLDQLVDAGLNTAVLCIGHLATNVQEGLGEKYRTLQLRYLSETEPLGTGGALRNAAFACAHHLVLAINGDSFVGTNFSNYIQWHMRLAVPASMIVTRVSNSGRFGTVQFTGKGRIKSFAEKTGVSDPGWINAGVYLFLSSWLRELPATIPCSIEQEVLPLWLDRGLYGYAAEAPFIDIGLPETLAAASQFFSVLPVRSP
jgi:D-glycero-alpha-D-manno-heptose 1-phosphate guanylyltransferase